MTDQENQELPEENQEDTPVKGVLEEGQAEVTPDAASELEVAQEEIAKLKDAFLRAKAEEDNVRRRAEKEVRGRRVC